MGKSYWMFVESPEEFEVTREHGVTRYSGPPGYRRRVERMQADDRVLFYVTSIRKWTATATIVSRSFENHSPVWNPAKRREEHPYRVELAPAIVLDEEDYIDALILAPRLEYVKRWPPEDWPLAFLDKLHLLPQRDFRLIEGELKRISKRRKSGRGKRPGKADGRAPEASPVAEAVGEAQEAAKG